MFLSQMSNIPLCIQLISFLRNCFTASLHPYLTQLEIGVINTFHRKYVCEPITMTHNLIKVQPKWGVID
jgi:hypothetical protein